MNRLACVGKSSKVPSKDVTAVKTVAPKQGDTPANKTLQLKTQTFKTSQSPRSEEHPLISDRRRNVTRAAVDPGPMKDSLNIGRNPRPTETPVNPRTSRSEAGPLLHPLSPADKTSPGQDESPKHFPPVHAEHNSVSETTEPKNEPAPQTPPYQEVLKCPNVQSAGEPVDEDDDNFEDDDDTAEFPAPLELLAEFLKAVMEKNYVLAKKLCQMILVYEPENTEARRFLPLIEERLQIEEAQEETCSEDNTSDDNDDDEGDDDDDDGDDDYDDSSDSDTDSDSSTSSSDAEEKNISHHQSSSAPP